MKSRKPAIFTLVFILLLISSSNIFSEENTDDSISQKTKSLVQAVYDFINEEPREMEEIQRALEDESMFLDKKNQLYIFMHTYDSENKMAVCIGQGARTDLIGKNMWHLRTPNGRHLFNEFTRLVETSGEGWLEYDWLNPYSRKIQTKVSYLKGIVLKDGRKAWIGCGYWKPRKGKIHTP